MSRPCCVEHRVPCVVLGGGGHAKVVVDAMLAAGCLPCAVLERDVSRHGGDLLGVPIRGDDEMLAELVRDGVRQFVVGVGTAGDGTLRRKLFELGLAHGLTPGTVRHPAAVCSPAATIVEGAQLLAGAIVNAGTVVAENAIVNTAAVVEHDCVIGRHAHVAPRACLGGGVKVGDGAHVGIGAIVRQGISIGAEALVAAGAVAVADVPARVVVRGLPARVWKQRIAA